MDKRLEWIDTSWKKICAYQYAHETMRRCSTSLVIREIKIKPEDNSNTGFWIVGNWTPTEGLMIAAGQFWRENEVPVQVWMTHLASLVRTSLFLLLIRKKWEKTPRGEDSWAKSWKSICQEDGARRTSKWQELASSQRHATAGSIWEHGVFQTWDRKPRK